MLTLQGQYTNCKIFTYDVEQAAMSQVYSFLNHPAFEGKQTRFMPDIHAGEGAVIGTTTERGNKVIPNVIGVDIGCGVTMWELGDIDIDFPALDNWIKTRVPSGRSIHTKRDSKTHSAAFDSLSLDIREKDFDDQLNRVCAKTGLEKDYALYSLGSLGGGNHFIEVACDEQNRKYLLIHSGSRTLGLKTAKFHQKKAKNYCRYGFSRMDEAQKWITAHYKTTDKKQINIRLEELKRNNSIHVPSGMEYLEGQDAEYYYEDMFVAQIYARLNRRIMGKIIISHFGIPYEKTGTVESIHNYINFEDNIIRKGAISAHKDEKILVPLNMAEGTLLGIGKGNADWNFSAPHGAGRLFSRSKAKAELSVDEFKERMDAARVWTSCVSSSTIDESPMAYKNADDIIMYVEDTMDIVSQLKPVYNFKASD